MRNLECRIKNVKWARFFRSAVFAFCILNSAFFIVSTAYAQVTAEVPGLILQAPDIRVVIANIIRIALGFLGIITVCLILYGGFLWMTAGGNEETIEKAKKVLTNSIIGLVIILTSFAITQFLISKFSEATRGPSAVSIANVGGGYVGLSPGSFVVRGIAPKGESRIRNIVVRVVLSRAPSTDAENLLQNIIVARKDTGAAVSGVRSVSGTTIEFRPDAACPGANASKKCFDENTEFTVEAKPGLLSSEGRSLICGGLAPTCAGQFKSGSAVDTQPPQVTLTSPDPGAQVSGDSCVPVQAHVTDDAGISSVEFYADDNLIVPDGTVTPVGEMMPTETDVSIPCWDTTGVAVPSEHILKAKAYDVDDNTKTSVEVRVMVRPLYCFNSTQDTNLGETGLDCGGQCGACDNAPCTSAAECAGGACVNGHCASPTTITGVSPADGGVGTIVGIAGYNFGATRGAVNFYSNKPATQVCAGATTWSPNQVLVGVPAGAETGPITIVKAGCPDGNALCRDSTNDERGPLVPVPSGSFEVNKVAHPGLCSLSSPPQNQAQGGWTTSVQASGVQFGAQPGTVSFGGVSGLGIAGWTDMGAQSAVPPIAYRPVQVQVSNAQGVPSNSLPYSILSPEAGTLPIIDAISCAPTGNAQGGVGTGCTISGRNFGASVGVVWFIAPDGQAVWADTSAPPQCAGAWWSPTAINVKVPEVLDRNNIDNDADTSERLTSAVAGNRNYQIYIHRYDLQDSNRKDFNMTNAPAGPYLACILPSSGPVLTNTTLYGERFGASVVSPRGVLFTRSSEPPQIRTVAQSGWTGVLAILSRVGGAASDACPVSGWSATEVCAQVPVNAVRGVPAGQVIVENDIGGITAQSNPVEFRVGDCRLPATDAAAISCGTLTCCGDGTCNSQCTVTSALTSAYGWQFSTAPAPVVPTVKEFCDPAAGDGHPTAPPSPAPWDRRMGNDVCVNSAVSIDFTTRLTNTAASLRTSGALKIDKCTASENLLTPADSTFGTQGPAWMPVDWEYIAHGRVQGRGRKKQAVAVGQTDPDPGNYALVLAKLDDDTGPDWENAQGIAQNYEHWFGYQANVLSSTNGGSFTASAWLKAATASAVGKKAGILIQRDNSAIGAGAAEAGFWMKRSQEITLTNEWQQATVEITFDRNGPNSAAPGFVRLFVEGLPHDVRDPEPRPDQQQLFSVYADDLVVTGDPCRTTQAVSLASPANLEVKTTGLNTQGIAFVPGSLWDINSWYRVTLLGGPNGIIGAVPNNAPAGTLGLPMEIMPDTSSCGNASAAYCFRFKTRDSVAPCQIGGVAVSPNPWTAVAPEEKIDYSALPVAAEDRCVPLRPGSDWSWNSSDWPRASVSLPPSTGHACRNDADCEVGPVPINGVQGASCVNNFCTSMPWTTTAMALAETLVNRPVRIIATTNRIPGSADLNIHFEDPKVVRYWPNCEEACTNAGIGAEFNIAMDGSTLGGEDVALWKIPCGNGTVELGEDCDDGNVGNGDGCSARCLLEGSNFNFKCGDGGALDPGEDCDDNNTVNGDGCSAACLHEGSITTCGNGTVNPNEDCDDGNTAADDGCSATCLHEGITSRSSVCGNGKLELGEECERTGLSPSGTPVFATWCEQTNCLRKGQDAPFCGNGRVDPGEECDRVGGAWPPNNLCGTVLDVGGTSTRCRWTGTQKPQRLGGSGCGNGRIEVGEDCDDGNLALGDGCSGTCLNEGSISSTLPSCGNGRQERLEDCDDGNVNSGDGCSAACLHEGTPTATCGNSRIDPGEGCDRGQIIPLLCKANCTNEGADSIACAVSSPPAYCTAKPNTCGNSRKDDGESCDDGNTVNGDGCSATCLNEGSDPARVGSIAPTYNALTKSLTLGPLNLLPRTFYRVLLRGDNQSIRSPVGKALNAAQPPELNFYYNWANPNNAPAPTLVSGTIPNTYTWTFRTRDSACAVNRVDLYPPEASLYVVGARQSFAATPFGAPDSCNPAGQQLNAEHSAWNWSTNDPAVTVADIFGRTTISNVSYKGVNVIPLCGNLRLERGEDCDDGNTIEGDGCSPQCLNEGSRYPLACGDRVRGPGEQCDPPGVNGVGCSSRCLKTGSLPCQPGQTLGCCGNTTLDAFENCDGGNSIPGDGCSARCLNEGSSVQTGQCGNGVVDHPDGDPAKGGEECDPLNLTPQTIGGLTNAPSNGYFCDPLTCLLKGTGRALCGNGAIEPGEDCDDNNVGSGDGCAGLGADKPCTNEGSSATRRTFCGNNRLERGEDCDDGNAVSNDGCSAICLNEGTIAESPPRIDPYQQAEAVGVREYEKARGWSIADVIATTSGKPGNAPLTVYCVARTEFDCPTPGGSSINMLWGRGSDNCCYSRPQVRSRSPSGAGACPNAMLRAVWNMPLNPESLAGNVRLVKVPASGTSCPTGTTRIDPVTGSTVAVNAAATSPLWCAPDDITLAPALEPATNGTTSVSALVLRPSRMLEANTHYKVLVYGDRYLGGNNPVPGIQSSRDVPLIGFNSGWDFTTLGAPCTLDEVAITVSPADTHFTRSGDTRLVHAKAISLRADQEIQPFVGSYAWTWSWGTEDGDIATVTNSADGIVIRKDQTVTAGTKNGTATINATARITADMVLTPSSVNRTVVGTQKFTTLLCDNPWPINPATGQFKRYEDSDGPDAVKPGTTPMNFSTYYCRDGQSVLPALQYPGAVRVAPDNERPLLKEFLLVGTGFNAEGEVGTQDGDDLTNGFRIADNADLRNLNFVRSGTVASDQPMRALYSFDISEEGDYELEVETSNWEDTNKHNADLSNLARVLEQEEVSESARGELERNGARLTGAVYHQLGVYLGYADNTPDGMISNIASGPAANHPRGSAILRGVRRGLQAITLEWLNDESLASIWDSNLRIYKVVLRKGKSRDDAIGIRVMENPQRLDVRAWYRARGFTGKPEAFPAVDGYEAIKDGNTVYVGAINAVPPDPADPQVFRQVYGNVYLITLSEGAGASTRAIYDQLIKNLTFNLNVENLKTCTSQFCSNDETRSCTAGSAASSCGAPDAVCIQKVCSNDLECKIDGSDTCRADKDKLRRDLARVNQLNSMQQSLEAYKARVGRYPTLESGTFIRSLTNSRWPSWQGALGAELGAPAPLDPINRFAQGCQTQSTERGTFDEATCWNEVLQTYRCPRGSHVYQYQSLGGLEYTLKAEFERLELSHGSDPLWRIVPAWPPTSIHTDGLCNWVAATGGSTWSATEARCGDRIVQPGAIPPEECEAGDTQTRSIVLADLHCSGLPAKTCTVDAGCKFCSNHPETGFSTCTTNSDCTGNGVCTQFGRCLPLTSCTASRSCGNTSCQWNPWIGNAIAAGVADCRPSSRYCGNGVVDPDSTESCDDGPLNGQYGKCKADCSGIGPHCGDPVLNNAAQSNPALRGPEVCDEGSLNGSYGHCRFDCTGPGERCGDTRVNGGESCDGGSQQMAGLCSTTTTQGCARNGDCPTGETCNLCTPEAVTNYAQARQRSCNAGCGWNAWGDCVVAGARCGNGVSEGSEQCDRPDDSDSTDDVNRNGIPDGNEDACNNDCTLARCGDGFDQGKVCTGNAASAGRTCTTDAQCGSGGRCADSEDCDLGGGNGTSCDPRYDGTCTFCDRQCNAVTVSGGFCGDRLWQTTEEQCDGAAGLTRDGGTPTWVCQGSIGVNEWFWNFTTVPETNWTHGGATLSRVTPGYGSNSAMKITATLANGEARFAEVPDTNGKTYIMSGWFNTLQTGGTRQVQLVMDRVGAPPDEIEQASLLLTLDNNASTWEYLEKQVVFDSGVDRDLRGILRIRVAGSGDEILADQVHLRPVASATCSGNTCDASCATGASCQNVGGDFDNDAIADACDNDQDNDETPNDLDCAPRNPQVNPDALEVCDDNIDSDCDGLGQSSNVNSPYSASNPDNECLSANIVVSDRPIVGRGTTADEDRFEVFLNERRKGIVDNTAPEQSVTISRLLPGDYTLRVELINVNGDGINNFSIQVGNQVAIPLQRGCVESVRSEERIRSDCVVRATDRDSGESLTLNLRIDLRRGD